jgi:hypothetical protein
VGIKRTTTTTKYHGHVPNQFDNTNSRVNYDELHTNKPYEFTFGGHTAKTKGQKT